MEIGERARIAADCATLQQALGQQRESVVRNSGVPEATRLVQPSYEFVEMAGERMRPTHVAATVPLEAHRLARQREEWRYGIGVVPYRVREHDAGRDTVRHAGGHEIGEPPRLRPPPEFWTGPAPGPP
jgi:hypothetical protein